MTPVRVSLGKPSGIMTEFRWVPGKRYESAGKSFSFNCRHPGDNNNRTVHYTRRWNCFTTSFSCSTLAAAAPTNNIYNDSRKNQRDRCLELLARPKPCNRINDSRVPRSYLSRINHPPATALPLAAPPPRRIPRTPGVREQTIYHVVYMSI